MQLGRTLSCAPAEATPTGKSMFPYRNCLGNRSIVYITRFDLNQLGRF